MSKLQAGAFIIVGTAVNIAMLAYDTTTLLKTLFASNAQKMLVSQWQNFQQPAPELTVAMLENFGLKRTRGSDWSTTVWSLEHNAFLNHSDDIIKLYNTTPFDIYTGKHYGWQNTTLTVEPIKIIEDLHNQEVFDAEGVRLGKLSWRAVVPLHNLGIPAETIDTVVDFGVSLYDELTTHGMESASDIIAYYQEVHQNWSSTLIPAEMPENYTIETETKELKPIAILLEEGQFTPPKNAVFHRAADWKHPTFQTPDIHL